MACIYCRVRRRHFLMGLMAHFSGEELDSSALQPRQIRRPSMGTTNDGHFFCLAFVHYRGRFYFGSDEPSPEINDCLLINALSRSLDTQSGSSPNLSEECVEGLDFRWFTDKHDV